MTTVLLIRHGMTDAVGSRIAGWLPGVALNPTGLAQVQRLGLELEPVRFDAIYTSPLERAAATAAAIAERQTCPIEQRPGLGEVRFGDWTGKTLEELEKDEVWRRWNTIRTTGRAPGGESMLELQARMFDELRRAHELHRDRTVALVSHADAIRALLVYLLGMSMDIFHRLRIDPASVSVVRMSDWSLEVAAINVHAEGLGTWLSGQPLLEHRRTTS